MAGKILHLKGLTVDLDDGRWTLELYFRNKRKSGGVISELRADPTDTRSALLVYDDYQALTNVLSKKTHQVDLRGSLGVVTLSVTLPEDVKTEPVLSSEADTESVFASNTQLYGISVELYKEKEDMVDERRFVLSGMAHSFPSDTISQYIQSCSHWADHSWERVDGDSIVVTFREDIDGHKFMQNVVTKRFHSKKIETRPLKLTNSVIIQGDKSHISDNFWKMYFSKEQRNEGEIIKSIVHVKQNKSMVITFEDWKVARRVAEGKHTLMGKKFVVAQLFYPDLQWVLKGQTRPQSNLSTDITNARREIQTHLEKNMVEHIPMEAEVWQVVMGSSPEIHVATARLEEVETLPPVKVIKSKMEKATDELQILKNTSEKDIQLDSKERLDLTVDNVVNESVMSCVELSKDTENFTIHLKGPSEKVQEAESFIHKFQDTLTSKKLDYCNNLTQFWQFVDLQKFQNDHFSQDNIVAVVIPSRHSVTVLAKKGDMERAEKKLREVIKQEGIPISGEYDKEHFVEQWKTFYADLTNELKSCQNHRNIFITFSLDKIELCGFCSVVDDVVAKVKACLEKKKIVTENVALKTVQEVDMVESCMKLSADSQLKALGATVLPCRSPQSPCLEVTATSDQIKKALDVVNMHKSHITTSRYMYSKAGEAKILKKNTSLLKMQAKGFGCNLEVSEKISQKFIDDLKCHVTSTLSQENPNITKGLTSAMQGLGYLPTDPTKTGIPLIGSSSAVCQLSAFSSLLSYTIVIAGVSVILKKADIIKENVDVIVNSNNPNLDLNIGVSGAILNAAGPSVVDECKKHGYQAINNVVLTGGGNLNCKYIAQIAGCGNITAAILNVLQLCESKQAVTVSMPSIGTGRGDRTPEESATAILQAVKMHLLSFPISSLKKIFVVAFDYFTYLGMKKYFDKGCHSKTQRAGSQMNSVRVTTLGLPLNQVKIKDTLIELKNGNITQETVKAIVNSTNANVNRNIGVSGAILKDAGAAVEKECAKIRPLKGNAAGVTSGGGLQCDFIIHIVGPKTVAQAFERVKNVLKHCEDKKIASVSFPAIGTGDGGMTIPGSMSALLFGIKQHLSQHNFSSLKQIFLVVDQDLGVQECQQSLLVWKQEDMADEDDSSNDSSAEDISAQSSQGGAGPSTTQPSLCLATACRAVSFPEVEVEVLGCCSSDVEKVKKLVDDLVSNEWRSCPISSPLLSQILESDKKAIVDLSQSLQVCVSLSTQDKATASGKTEDALTMVLQMEKYLNSAKERVTRQEEEKRLRETVRWEVSVWRMWAELDPTVSLDLEHALHKKEPSISYTEQQQTYTVNLDKMERTDGNGTIAKIRRTLKAASEIAIIELPEHWDRMGNKTMDIVDLSPTSEEYQTVQENFLKTSKDTLPVIKIQRIQNMEQWRRYAVKKQMLDNKYPKTKNEMNLYHGTTAVICQNVNSNGFNRGYCGRNATYGKGTYFAKESWYSCNDKYSYPDDQGVKYMYQARVLVGKPCLGVKGMVEPNPLDPANPQNGLHDCAVNNITSPSIYVVFCDAGAYPEYLISFKAAVAQGVERLVQ